MDELLDLQELIDKLQDLLELGFFDEAQKLLDYYLNFYPDEPDLYFLYSRVHLEQNRPAEAIPFLHKSLRLEKNNVDCLLGLFYSYAQLGNLKKGSKFLFKAEKYHPDNDLVYSALIWYYTEVNNLDEALALFGKAQKSGTDNPETFRNAGLAFQRSGDYQKAEQCFLTALNLNPRFDDVRDLLADHYILSGQGAKSIALYRDYLVTSPKNIRAMSRLVFCLSQNNRVEEALEQARETIRLYPNSPVGYVDCSYVYLNEDKLDDALTYANKALDVSPIDAEALRVKGIALSDKKQTVEAGKAFTEALALDPQNPEIMRDYYHFLKSVGEIRQMEKIVNRVIKQEHPYCMEDYWFLADYYRERKESLKSFHFLHKAYRGMPGEKDLLPPMIDIMLDAGHVSYSLPFMMRYVERSGWNDAMNRFAKHKRLKGKWAQEGLRLLRFYGQKTAEFRRYLFFIYFEKFFFLSLALLLPLVLLLLYFFVNLFAAVCAVAAAAGLFGGWKAVKALLLRKKS